MRNPDEDLKHRADRRSGLSRIRHFLRRPEWIGTLTPEDAEEAILAVYGCKHGLTLHDGLGEYTETYVGTTHCIRGDGHEGSCRPPHEHDGEAE